MKFKLTFLVIIIAARIACLYGADKSPNIIMLMADDLGWGDVGFNGNTKIITPHLDEMSESGIRFTQFYAAAPLCSPSRASCLTGRNPFRQGMYAAHTGGMRVAETTIAEILKKNGYATGIFGKWHLGWIEPDQIESRGHYSPPWHHGYDDCFVTKSAVPTWNPTKTPEGWSGFGSEDDGSWGGSRYLHNGIVVNDNLDGDDSRIIMDRAIPFIEKSVKNDQPFFATIWFHTPHEPVVAGPKYLAKYPDLPVEQQHLYGCITAMDEQIGRLIKFLEDHKLAENTVIFFASDNGPSGPLARRGIASAGPFKGTKHEVWEGGIRVPSIMYWKGQLEIGECHAATGTVDYLPTIVDILDLPKPKKGPIDGESMLPKLTGEKNNREKPLSFGYKRLYKDTEMYALIDGDYKLVIPKMGAKSFLFNIETDSIEQNDLSETNSALKKEMLQSLDLIIESWQNSDDGNDYIW
jgi:arylsulfatase A-like enzyme